MRVEGSGLTRATCTVNLYFPGACGAGISQTGEVFVGGLCAHAPPPASGRVHTWLRDWGLGFGVWGLGFGVWGLGFGVWGLEFRV